MSPHAGVFRGRRSVPRSLRAAEHVAHIVPAAVSEGVDPPTELPRHLEREGAAFRTLMSSSECQPICITSLDSLKDSFDWPVVTESASQLVPYTPYTCTHSHTHSHTQKHLFKHIFTHKSIHTPIPTPPGVSHAGRQPARRQQLWWVSCSGTPRHSARRSRGLNRQLNGCQTTCCATRWVSQAFRTTQNPLPLSVSRKVSVAPGGWLIVSLSAIGWFCF